MKITRRELDSEILNKLDQFDKIVESFDSENGDGFISYGPSGFYFKKTNDTFLKKVFNEDEIVDLENSLTSKKRNIRSSLMEDLRADKKMNSAAKKFIYNLSFSDKILLDSKIALVKKVDKFLLVFTQGILHVLSSEGDKSFNILEKINDNFNLMLKAYNVVSITKLGEYVFIATKDNGIFKFSLANESIEMISNIQNVKDIEATHTGALFVVTDEFCAIYDIVSGLRIEKYSILYNERQAPVKIIKTEKGIFVLGAPVGIQSTRCLLHYWKLDDAGVAYNNADGFIEPHPLDNSYQILAEYSNEEAIYLTGKVSNKVFIWKYDLNTLHLEEKIFDLPIISLDGFLVLNNNYVFLSKNMLYTIKDDEIDGRYKLENNCKGLLFDVGELITVNDSSILKISLPQFETKSENLSYNIYESTETCNNIDIYVKNATRNERIILLDGDSGREITPSYYIIYNGSSILKLMNCKSLKIKMNVSVNPSSNLGGIVIKNNRMFLR